MPGRPLACWEQLQDHLAAVGETASRFAEPFGFAQAARVAGLLHDIGKVSAEFQAYITGGGPSRDHSTAGAREALAGLPPPLGRMLASIIAGHHAGLADGTRLESRLDPKQHPIPAYAGWQAHASALPEARVLSPTRRFTSSPEKGFTEAFLLRMLFSCLVDADFLETERFYAGAEGRDVERGEHTDLETLRDRLRRHTGARIETS